MPSKLRLLSACFALAALFATQGCDVTEHEALSTASAMRTNAPCNGFIVVGVWGQSNAARADRRDELQNGVPIDVAYALTDGTTNVIRQNGGGSYTQMRDENRDGGITQFIRRTAYVDLANEIYDATGLCVVYSSAASSGSAMQEAANPGRHWDPDSPTSILDGALVDLREAIATFDPEHVVIYWNQGLRDALSAHPDFGSTGVTVDAWYSEFVKLTGEVRDSLAVDGRRADILLSLSGTDLCLIQSDPITDSLMTRLHDLQRQATETVPEVYLVSEVMPDSTTSAYYTPDARHLRWTQYRDCENPAILHGLTKVIDEANDFYWTPFSTCSLTYPDPPECGTLRGRTLETAFRAALDDDAVLEEIDYR